MNDDHSRFDSLLKRIRDVDNEDRLAEILADATKEYGFDQFAMGHHVDLARPPRDAIRLTNYDSCWIEQSLAEGYYLKDPVHAASARRVCGFRWDEMSRFFKMSADQALILDRAKSSGLGAGFTVPVYLPGEYSGTCSFAARDYEKVRSDASALLSFIAKMAFEAARRIKQAIDGRGSDPVPSLTPRQRQSLVFVAQGKSDGEIASIMGISPGTAHDHVEGARRAYGNAQRPHLVIRALFDNLISYTEALHR